MKYIFSFFACLLISFLSFSQTIVYVNSAATGNKSGSSWQNACTHLSDAVAKANGFFVSEIWVRNNGSYSVAKTTNRAEILTLSSSVSVYGGFNGTETDKTQRLPNALRSVISGEIGNSATIEDNSYQAFRVKGVTRFDGVIFQFFNCKVNDLPSYGAIVSDTNAKLTITNATFDKNEGHSRGLCLSALQGSITTLDNVTVTNNNAAGSGSLFTHNADAKMKVTNCTFNSNGATGPNAGYGNIFYSLVKDTNDKQVNKKMLLEVNKCQFKGNTLGLNFSYFGSSSFRNSTFDLLAMSTYTFNNFGDSATLIIDSCNFTGRYASTFLYAAGLKDLWFTNSRFENPDGDKYYLFNMNCHNITFKNAVFVNVQGSIPFYFYSKEGRVTLDNVLFDKGESTSYYLYIVSKEIICRNMVQKDMSSSLGNFMATDTADFFKCSFENLEGSFTYLPLDQIRTSVFDSCNFSGLEHTYSLFRVIDGQKLLIQHSSFSDIRTKGFNPGAPLIFASWGGSVSSVNNTFHDLYADGRIAENGGELFLFGNVFSRVSTGDVFLKNYGNLKIYNSNFADLDIPLFINDSTYYGESKIHFELVNSVVYTSSDTVVLVNAATQNYSQLLSNNYTNKTLTGTGNTNLSAIPYSVLYAGNTSTALQDKGGFFPGSPSRDVLGNPRISGSKIDIGAIEFKGVITALEKEQSEEIFHIYPNPVKDHLLVETNDAGFAEIIDLKGVSLVEFKLEKGQTNLPVEFLMPGSYILKVKLPSQTKTAHLKK